MAYNDPVGSTQLVNHPFNDFSAFFFGSAEIVQDATAPVSPPNVMKSTLPAFAYQGGTQLNLSIGSPRTDMYCRINWRTNAGFQGRRAQDKLFFMRGPDSNGFFGLLGGPTKGGPFTFYFGHNSGNVDNSHTMSSDLGLIGYPNVGSGVITAGQWTILEAYVKRSTTLTSRDGIVKWWVNGVPAGSYTNINYGPSGLNEWIWTETWDGCGRNGANCDIGTSALAVNTVEWAHYVDHLYISSGGTLVPGGTPPPEPDPTPQPQVVLQGLTPANQSAVVGTAKQFTISMSGPVLSSTSLFTNSSAPSVATVPASVNIPTGSATALVTATPVAIGSTTITTSYNGVTKGATLHVTAAPTTGGAPTTYTYTTDFSSTQGPNWYYLEGNGTQMTYIGASSLWRGSDTAGGSVQLIWGDGFHPGGTQPSMLRFVVPLAGSAQITGAFNDVDTGGGTGVVARVNYNGSTIFTRTIANGDSTGGDYDVTQTVVVGDFIDFVVSNQTGDYTHNSTSLNPVITITPATSPPDPTTEPEPPVTVTDLFASTNAPIVPVAFTMTVRLSRAVTVDTAVEIRVGSSSVLTAPTSVTVAIGTSEKSFTVTPIAASLVAIEAVLNGTKRVTLNVQPAPSTTPPDIDTGPVTDPLLPTIVRAIIPVPDGASLILSQRALALAFKYDAQPEWVAITDFPPSSSEYVHTFTWPSGTTTICYRAKAIDGTWGASSCVPFVATPPTPPPPVVNKAIIDSAGIRWQLTGKKSPYELKRNGSTMDNTYGVALRKSGDGYMELLQANGVWIRRNGNSWEFVA